jgi:hypothetical protein
MPGPVAIAGLIAALMGAGLIAFTILIGVRLGVAFGNWAVRRWARRPSRGKSRFENKE